MLQNHTVQQKSLNHNLTIPLNNNCISQPDFNPAVIEKIEDYMNGNLNIEEIEELWAFFILNPEWYSFFETYLTIKSLSDQF